MEIRHFNKNQWTSAYSIFCRSVFSLGEHGLENPFALTECRVDPLGQTTHHHHDDQEIFFIQHGEGHMSIGDETEAVMAGDAVFIPPHQIHSLKNTSTTNELLFFSLAWLAPRLRREQKPTLVIPAPPTPNGPLHLGHLSGPYLAADVFNRYQKLRGSRSALFIGTDDNQCYISNKARSLGITNDGVLEKFIPEIHAGFNRFLVAADVLLTPKGNKDYSDFIEHFFQTLVDRGAIILNSAPTVFCNNSLQFIYGADVNGECPYCQNVTVGHGCEQCGHYNDGHDLANLRSIFGNNPVSLLNKERYYFPLNEHRDFLVDMLASCTMHPRLRAFYKSYLTEKLPDVTASQFADWGIDAPYIVGQKIYEWIEMAGAYVYFMHKAQERLDTNIENIALVEAFGFDNSFFYGLLVPALINAYDPALPKPQAFLSNYFYLLNNEKFSTSRNHAIWANDLLARLSPDLVRMYLALTRAEDEPTNFTVAAFKDFVSTTIHGRWHEFFKTLNKDLATLNCQWSPVSKLKGYQERFVINCKEDAWAIDEAYGTMLSLNEAARGLLNLMARIETFYRRNRHTSEDFSDNLSLVMSAISAWTYAISPIMPKLSENIQRSFGDGLPREHFFSVNTRSAIVSPIDLGFFSQCEQEVAALDELL